MQQRPHNNRLDAATQLEPQDLWERAYDTLRKQNPELVLTFEKHLVSCNESHTSFTSSSFSPNQIQAVAESRLIDHEAEKWVIRLRRQSIKVREQWDNVIKFILWAKESVSAAVEAQPYAALAWAGVSIVLPVSQNHKLEHFIQLLEQSL